MGATLVSHLVCEECYFDAEPRFTESTAKTVWIVGSRLPGFDGTRMRLDGILNLRSSVIRSVVSLDQAKVTGQVCLRGGPKNRTAALDLRNFISRGLTRDNGAWVLA